MCNDKGEQVVAEARIWVGTPFSHTGRTKGIGVDCCGLIIKVFDVVYNMSYDNVDYSPVAPAGMMEKELRAWCDEVPRDGDWCPGDVLLFKFFGIEQHVAFWTGSGIIHAYTTAKHVAEHGLNMQWSARVSKVFRFRETQWLH